MPRSLRSPSVLVLLGLAVLVAALWLSARRELRHPPPPIREVTFETWARQQFLANHPGEKPLNWAIGRVAVEFHRSQPMGKFVLGLTPGQWGNDCSDFVACIVDEGLGVGARFNRGSQEHVHESSDIMQAVYWTPEMVVQPGDIVSVRHSPWYEPQESSCWHVGILGTDGMVYDFTKLKRWKEARYGRNPFAWFVRHSRGPRQALIRRLRPQYRYRIEALPSLPRDEPTSGETGADVSGGP